MKKVKSTNRVIRKETVFREYGFGTLDEFIADLIKIRDEHSKYEEPSHYIELAYDQYYDDVSDFRLVIVSERLETDKEAADREAAIAEEVKEANRLKREKAKKAREKREQAEREEYERFKKKYEK